MHGNHGRSQRRGQGAIEDRQAKVKERQPEVAARRERKLAEIAVNRAAFEKRAK